MPSSFICEHTVEYTMTHWIYTALKDEYTDIIPFYFWRSREGNKFSENMIQDRERYKLIAVYPRRPKYIKENIILVKLNETLFESTRKFNEHGIPTFAALPLVNKISKLCYGTDYMIFNLIGSSQDIELQIDLNKLQTNTKEFTLEINAFKRQVNNYTNLFTWKEIVEKLRAIRFDDSNLRQYFFSNNYKPVYFLLGNEL